jgi:acyl carrier protein
LKKNITYIDNESMERMVNVKAALEIIDNKLAEKN